MDRVKPEHMNNLPRDRSAGMTWVVVLGIVLLVTLAGAWQIYIRTALRWQERFDPEQAISIPKEPAEKRNVPEVSVAELEELREQARKRAAQAEISARQIRVDKCIDGVAFQRMKDGGWENIPGLRCR